MYLVPDRQGTDELTIDSSTYAVTRRQYLPFGQTRGSAPTTWPGGDKSYVGGTFDPSTGLENLGSREYNPANGRFLSADSVFEASDPTQMGGYDYAGNNSATNSDPTGACPPDKCGAGVPSGSGNGDILLTSPETPYGGTIHNHRWYPVYHGKPWKRAEPRQSDRAANTAGGKLAGEVAPRYRLNPNGRNPSAGFVLDYIGNVAVLALNLAGVGEALDGPVGELDASTGFFDAPKVEPGPQDPGSTRPGQGAGGTRFHGSARSQVT